MNSLLELSRAPSPPRPDPAGAREVAAEALALVASPNACRLAQVAFYAAYLRGDDVAEAMRHALHAAQVTAAADWHARQREQAP